MAKIETKVVLIKLSKIVKDGDSASFDSLDEVAKALEDVAQEMCGGGTVAEVELLDD